MVHLLEKFPTHTRSKRHTEMLGKIAFCGLDTAERNEVITPNKFSDTTLPKNSEIVHAGSWRDYFGPFAGRMFLGPDDNTFDINSVTSSLLQFVVTPEDANEIAKKRPFASIEDAARETQILEHCLKGFKCETQNVS